MFNVDRFGGSVLGRAAVLLGIVAASVLGYAQNVQDNNPQNQISLEQKLGQQVALDAQFKDEAGRTVKLGDYFGERPVILVLVFYRCNGSCLLIKQGVLQGLNALKEKEPGKDYELVTISIHPKETPDLAKAKKAEWIQDFRYAKDADHVHFLTGDMPDIQKVADSVGFGFKYDEVADTIRHPAAITFATAEGRVSSYMFGVTYPQRIIQTDIDQASKGLIGPPDPKPILWGCLSVDPRTGKTTLVVHQLLKVFGIGTVLILFTSIFVMSKKHRRQALYSEDSSEQGGVPDNQS